MGSAATRATTPAGTGRRTVSAIRPAAVEASRADGSDQATARVALSQLDAKFVHIELRDGGCPGADEDVRIRSDDLLAGSPPVDRQGSSASTTMLTVRPAVADGSRVASGRVASLRGRRARALPSSGPEPRPARGTKRRLPRRSRDLARPSPPMTASTDASPRSAAPSAAFSVHVSRCPPLRAHPHAPTLSRSLASRILGGTPGREPRRSALTTSIRGI
jgi:hypothetical protein